MKIDNVDNAALVSQLRARLPKDVFVNISDYQILLMYLFLRKDINETIKSDTLQAMKAAMVFVSNLHENRHIEPPAVATATPKLKPLPNDFRVDVSLENGFTVVPLPEPKAIPKKKKLTDYEFAIKCIRQAQKSNLSLAYVCKVIAVRGREVDLTNADYLLLSRNSSFPYDIIVEAFAPMQIVWPKRR